MIKEIKYLIFLLFIIFFFFLQVNIIFQMIIKKILYRSLNNIDKKINIYAEKLPSFRK